MRIVPVILSVICQSCIFYTLCIDGVYAFTGTTDERVYVNWPENPFNKYVYMDLGASGNCTAQFVGPDLILTAAHCLASGDSEGVSKYNFSNYKNESFEATLIKHGDFYSAQDFADRRDWALFRISDQKYHTTQWFEIEVAKDGTVLTVDNAGWGALKILSPEEIGKVRKAFEDNELRRQQEADTTGAYRNKCGTPELRAQNTFYCELMEESYGCNENGCAESGTYTPQTLRMFVDGMKKKIGIDGLLDDNKRLKAHRGCRIVADKKCIENGTCGIYVDDRLNMPYVLPSDCDTYGGNSGGAFLHNGNLVAIVSYGHDQTNEENAVYATSALQFADVVRDALKSSPKAQETTNSVAQPPVSKDVSVIEQILSDNTGKTIADYDSEITQIQSNIQKAMDTPVNQMSDRQLLRILDDMDTLQRLDALRENARKMKEREQSITNRLVGAAAIGLTGIGAMNLMSGLAEQSADEDAERDMRAYLETFRCDYGAGRNIRGGETNIELPGGNELLPVVTEYKQLAADLKQRKDVLGLSPGIEAEFVFDSAETGLYDNVALGKNGGAYTSLSRALTDENSKDAAQWAEQKSGAQNKTKTGAIIGGAGVAVGVVGNVVEDAVYNKKN